MVRYEVKGIIYYVEKNFVHDDISGDYGTWNIRRWYVINSFIAYDKSFHESIIRNRQIQNILGQGSTT